MLYEIAVHLINKFDEIDKVELAEEHRMGKRPTVLVFLPGIHEITRLENILREEWDRVYVKVDKFVRCEFWVLTFSLDISRNEKRTKIITIVLHSSSDSQQRKMAFSKVPPQTRKIILATNIAESSITVPHVKYGSVSFRWHLQYFEF